MTLKMLSLMSSSWQTCCLARGWPLSETMLLCAARKGMSTKSGAPASEVASRLMDCV